MTNSPDSFPVRVLLENSSWLSQLAHRLVTDEQRADDVVQEAWLALLESPPKNTDTPRAWLATVARRLAQRGFRSEARRLQRERKVARPEATAPSDITERAETHKRLVDAVLGLDEPYRSTLLERYFDERTAAEIAELRQQPAATIRSQIARGLELLRDRLDETHGGNRRAWCLSLLPLAITASPPRPAETVLREGGQTPPARSTAPRALATVAVGFVVILVSWLALPAFFSSDDPLPPSSLEETASAEPAAPSLLPTSPAILPSPEGASNPDDSVARAAMPQNVTNGEADSSSDESDPPFQALGMVQDTRGNPVSGIPVFIDQRIPQGDPNAPSALPRSGAEVAITDGDGAFTVQSEGLSRYTYLLAEDSEFTTLRRGWFQPEEDARVLIVVAPVASLSGTVKNTAGDPLPAHLYVEAPHQRLVDFPESLEDTSPRSISVRTIDDGSFTIPRCPDFHGAELNASCPGYQSKSISLASVSGDFVDVVLEAVHSSKKNHVHGVVLFSDRTPASDVSVRFGNDQTTSDEQGHFSLLVQGRPSDTTPLAAVEPGLMPSLVPNFGATWRDRDPSLPVELVLGDESLTIEGTVLGDGGKPQTGWQIRLIDATEISVGVYPATSAEGLAGGNPNHERQTDEEGRFLIRGLLDRDYRILAYDPQTLVSIRSNPTAAGTEDLTLRVPRDAFISEVRGHVVSRAGRSLSGVRINAILVTSQGDSGSTWVSGGVTLTNEAGAFRIPNCPRVGVKLSASGENIIPIQIEFDPSHRGPVEIEVAERCRFRVEADHLATLPEHGQIIDTEGRALSVFRFVAGGSSSSNRMKLVEGQTPILAVSEDARTLVLTRDNVEVARVPIQLNPDEVTILKP